LADVLKAQATFKHARTLWNDLGQPDDITTVEEDSLLQAFASWWYTNVHRVSDYGPRHDPISRSTSVIANVIDDCNDWAIAEIRSRVAWAGARDELERRVTQALSDARGRRANTPTVPCQPVDTRSWLGADQTEGTTRHGWEE